jgi:hypothetical protein
MRVTMLLKCLMLHHVVLSPGPGHCWLVTPAGGQPTSIVLLAGRVILAVSQTYDVVMSVSQHLECMVHVG